MKNIKFRAFDLDGNRMINFEELLEHDYDKDAILIGLLNDQDGWLSKQYTIMQSTGLFDKNDKEIYEGDIVNIGDYECCKKCGHGKRVYREKVYFNNGMFTTNGFTPLDSDILHNPLIEVIGNIYEDKELLETNI